MSQDVQPTERELEILKILWERGEGTVREVYEQMRDTAPIVQNTVQAFLRTMEEKGLVRHRTEGRTFIYQAVTPRMETSRNLVSGLLQRVFDGAVDQLVQSALSLRQPTSAEMSRLEELLEEVRGAQEAWRQERAAMIDWQAAFSSFLAFLAENGLWLVAGLTGWLLLGGLVVALARAPIHQVRLGELVLLLTLAWLGLALVPLERWTKVERWLTSGPEAVPAAQSTPRVPQVPPSLIPDTAPVAMRVAPDSKQRASESSLRPAYTVSQSYTSAGDLSEHTFNVDSPAPSGPETKSPSTAGTDFGSVSERPSSGTRAALPPTATATENSPRSPWAQRLALAWLGGLVLCTFWLALGQGLLLSWQLTAKPADAWLAQLYAGLPWPNGKARPRLLVSQHSSRPIAFGLWRPTILLPADCFRRERPSQVRHILLHELGHVRQRDALGQALFNLLLPLFWFHPLYWWLRGRVHLCRELLADDWAASLSTKESYAFELIDLIKCKSPRRQWGPGALAMFATSTEFYRRMTMLLERSRPLATRCSWWWRMSALAAGVLAVLLFTSTLGVSAYDEDEDDGDDAVQEVEEEGDEEAEAEEDGEESGEEEAEDREEEDEADEEGEDEDQEASEDEDDDEDEGEAGEDEEAALSELIQRREGLAQELSELESRINETNQTREQRLAEQEWQAQQEAKQAELAETEAHIREALRPDAEELEQRILTRQSAELAPVLEQINGLLEAQESLRQSLGEVTAQMEELRQQRDALAAEVAELRETLSQLAQPAEEESNDE